jgi:hypothetical protein
MSTHQTALTKPKTPAASSPSSFTPVRSGILQRKCACGGKAGADGKCEECKKKKLVQTKLKIGMSNDPLEQEADRVAAKVLATPVQPAASAAPPQIQRYSGQSNEQAETAPASVDQVLAGPGRPLDATLRQDMEQRFGHDFSKVRVHSGAAAEQSAMDVNANAYAVGHNIVFGAGQLASETSAGRRLIAHELTHVVQQSSAGQTIKNHNPVPNAHRVAQLYPAVMVQKQPKSSKCTNAEVSTLNLLMHVSCNKPRSCSLQGDNCATATAKVAAGNGCVRARTELQQKCFSRGDPGYEEHMKKIAQDSVALRNCIAVMTFKCAQEAATAAALAAALAAQAAAAVKAARLAEAVQVTTTVVEGAEEGVTVLEVLEGIGLVLAL